MVGDRFMQSPASVSNPPSTRVVALVGNPNCGKTTLFNRLTGLLAHTSNFAGTTVEYREALIPLGRHQVRLVDLPGLYSLDALSPDERAACDVLAGGHPRLPELDAIVLVADVTNLSRNLFLVSEVLELCSDRQLPVIVALNMSDVADKHGLQVNTQQLEIDLGCRVFSIAAKTGAGVDSLLQQVDAELFPPAELPVAAPASLCASCRGCGHAARYDWAERTASSSVRGSIEDVNKTTERIDAWLTHPWMGLVAFAGVMLATFLLIFWLAQWPMEWIDTLMSAAGALASQWLPEGLLQSLVSDGIVGGVGGILVFLPQICILFLLLALLEDSGYLARAAFVMDRLMYRVGLPGKAFVPMLSAHACAIPAIMASRVIEDRRDRLVTILVLPLLTCSARLPVYAMVIALLFAGSPVLASLLFAAAYTLGIVAALVAAWVLKLTILPGATRPLVIELPNYHIPSLRSALLVTRDRAWAFIKNAGTTILVISLVMWAIATFPRTSLDQLPADLQTAHRSLVDAGDADAADALLQQAQLERSIAGRTGKFIEPVFAPLGFDWKISIGVLSSFAAREVIVSNLAILYGLGDAGADDSDSLYDSLRASRHADGSPVFTTATCLSLLVFYVLAMQCLPTQVVTARETGHWKWAVLQIAYMTLLAYAAAWGTYQAAQFI
jgi:ferrous iron transport protein B